MRTCRGCRNKFEPVRQLQAVCSPECALLIAMEKTRKEMLRKASAERQDTTKRRKAMRTMSELRRKAQTAFNAYIRERDSGEACISCGRFHDGQWHAGHYLTTAAHPELRFDPRNCHKQCAPCNNHLSGNLIAFRQGLIQRYGQGLVDWLEGPHEPLKLSRDELVAEEAKWKEARRKLVAEKNSHT